MIVADWLDGDGDVGGRLLGEVQIERAAQIFDCRH